MFELEISVNQAHFGENANLDTNRGYRKNGEFFLAENVETLAGSLY